MVKRPEIVTDEMLIFLDDLRESGVTNMFGAGVYIQREFSVGPNEAQDILQYWMDTFGQRHHG